MAKNTQRTRVVVNGQDVSNAVIGALLDRDPKNPETVTLTMVVDKLDVDSGVLVIYIESGS